MRVQGEQTRVFLSDVETRWDVETFRIFEVSPYKNDNFVSRAGNSFCAIYSYGDMYYEYSLAFDDWTGPCENDPLFISQEVFFNMSEVNKYLAERYIRELTLSSLRRILVMERLVDG